jgi:hypothetical protein
MESFRIGLTISPSGIHTLGITQGDWREGVDFVHEAAPIIAEFSERFADAYRRWTAEAPRNAAENEKGRSLL